MDDKLNAPGTEMSFNDWCSTLRNEIKRVGREVKSLYAKTEAGGEWAEPATDVEPEGLRTEMIANVILCYRHLEDSAMRLGKAIQAKDGGKSVYDK
jgi:hypothetical protein